MNREDPTDQADRTIELKRDPTPGQPYDDSAQRFRDNMPEQHFSGSSGILFEQAMAQTRMAVCLSDPHQEDMPVVFANRAFRELTGYDEDEIVGRNCRFLQGPRTDKATVAKIRHAIENEDVVVVELVNYRKDGTPFWNALHLGPIYRDDGELLYFFGSQWDVSNVRTARADERYAREMARELSHRMKNMFAVISGIVNITGRMRGVQEEALEINERVQALGRAYETTLDEASSGSIEIGPAIAAILEPYDVGDDGIASETATGKRLDLLGNGQKVPFSVISGVGLTLHELAANSLKYGAWSRQDGRVSVDWKPKETDDGLALVVRWVEQGGPAVSEPPGDKGTGHAIIDRLLKLSGGTIERKWNEKGLEVEIAMPIGNVA